MSGLGPSLMRKLLPVFEFDLAPGALKTFRYAPFRAGADSMQTGWNGGDRAGHSAALDSRGARREERRDLWNQTLDDADLASELAAHHRHGCGRIAHRARLARGIMPLWRAVRR